MESLSHQPKRTALAGNVMLSDRDATDTARLLNLLAGTPRDPLIAIARQLEQGKSHDQAKVISSRPILIATAKKILIARRSRGHFFDDSIFSEPAWDMLLALYITEESEARHSISRLTEFAGAAPTTSLRWISHLERMGLVSRVPHPNDLRTAFIEITDDARHALDGYFSRIVAMGLAN